mgnify:CR=1 FL=1
MIAAIAGGHGLGQLDGLRADLATRLGVDAPGVDVLAQHPDLKAKVDGMTLSREDALERIEQNKAEAPYLMYDAVMDEATRDEHAAWDGTVLPVSDPWWNTHTPPILQVVAR